MSEPLRLATPVGVRARTVVEVKATRGAGTNADPVREVTQYWSADGKLLAERDPVTDLTVNDRMVPP